MHECRFNKPGKVPSKEISYILDEKEKVKKVFFIFLQYSPTSLCCFVCVFIKIGLFSISVLIREGNLVLISAFCSYLQNKIKSQKKLVCE